MYQLYNGTNPFEGDLVELFAIQDDIYEQLFIHLDAFYLDKLDERDTVTIFNAEIQSVIDYLKKQENLPNNAMEQAVLTQITKALITTKNAGKDFFVLHFIN